MRAGGAAAFGEQMSFGADWTGLTGWNLFSASFRPFTIASAGAPAEDPGSNVEQSSGQSVAATRSVPMPYAVGGELQPLDGGDEVVASAVGACTSRRFR